MMNSLMQRIVPGNVITITVLAMLLSCDAFAADAKAVGGIAFETPEAWRSVKPRSSMRAYEFKIPAPEEAGAQAELAVFYFGSAYGGTAEQDIERWKSQFAPLREGFEPVVESSEVNGIKVTTVHLEGTYDPGMGMMSAGPQSGYAALSAIVAGPEGPVFFKLTGPRETVLAARPGFESLIQSIEAASKR